MTDRAVNTRVFYDRFNYELSEDLQIYIKKKYYEGYGVNRLLIDFNLEKKMLMKLINFYPIY